MSIKAILFDHDGTLVDSEPAHFRIWRKVLSGYGVDLSEQQYRDHYAGVPSRANAVDMVSRFSIEAEPDSLAREKVLAMSDFISRTAFPLMPGTRETVRRFHALGLQLAIVTGSGQEVVTATTRTHSLLSLFATVVSGDDVQRNKPHPDGYLLAMQRLGLSAKECLAVEDTEAGLNAATEAGIDCLVVPNDMSTHHDFSRAREKFARMDEVGEWVERRLL
ncbi:HAD family hydrolase [Microbulbifer sp.]|uniref:HAD family hydrolase n=1 Tax=Microbulbifer sp. TaxID=1908541 RepID=UPI003F2EC366